jgi:antagonist of KipI
VYTTIQDLGRFGLMRYGIPPSGAMDQSAYRIANYLVGNGEDAACLEVGVYGLQIEALAPATVAIAGADLCPHLNGQPIEQWLALQIDKGDILHFKRRRTGMWSYVAFGGGLNVPQRLGSCSVFSRGMVGAPVAAGEIIPIGSASAPTVGTKPIPEDLLSDRRSSKPIRVVCGPQEKYFTRAGIDTFLHSEYRITPQSDRMAFRMEGPAIEIAKGPDIISEPIARGGIQVPGNGQPIVLLRDAQVTGGYAKIATVATVDTDRLVQGIPGTAVRFQSVAREEAVEALCENRKRLAEIKRLLQP